MIALLMKGRSDAGLTRAGLGARWTFVSTVELGERCLDAAEFVAVARAIGVDLYGVMGEAEEREVMGWTEARSKRSLHAVDEVAIVMPSWLQGLQQ